MLGRVLALIVAAGVVIAGVVLWRIIPSRLTWVRRFRWLIAALTAYGAVSFIYAAVTGTTVRDALSGHGLFQSLQYAIQGAFLGGFVILPLAWIASVIRVGIPRFRERAPRPIWYQATALTTCLALLIASVEIRRLGGKHLDPQARIALLDKSLRALEDGDREMPRDTWDPDYVISMVGRDSLALFRWVQQNTYWIPYHGELRGPVGVLMDRQGNSLDRAVLLATLLEKAGYTVRLAHGELPADQASKLLPELVADREIALHDRPNIESGNLRNLDLVSGKYGLNNTSIQQTLSTTQQEIAELYSELRARVKDQSDRLLQVVNRPKPAAEWLQRYELALTALRDHWWVQQQSGDKWNDLDLLQAAGAIAEPESTTSITGLSADVRHEITLRVISEQESHGKLTEHVTLESVLRPADLLGRPIVLQFWPEDWASDSGQLRVPTEFRHAALAQQTWGAALEIGDKPTASGILLANGDDPKAPQKGGVLGGIAAAFSNTIGLSQNDPNRQLSAVWIEYEIRVPGEKPRTVRRNVFDLIGPAARASGASSIKISDSKRLTRSLALMMRTEILPISCPLSPEFLVHLAAQSLIGNHELINSAIRGDLVPGTPASDALLGRMTAMVSPLYSLAEARFEWGSDPDSMFVDRPQLLTSHFYAVSKGDEIALRDATDIVANDFGVSLTVPDGFAARLTQGVLDTNAEAIIPWKVDTFGNAAEAFAKSGAWVHVADADQAGGLRLPPDSLRGIADDVSSGYDVVAPHAAIPMSPEDFSGWWRIDRNWGTALGMGANGWGQAAEYNSQSGRAAQQEPMWFRMYKGARTGFVSGYSWCVAVNAYEQVREDKLVIQERVTARVMSNQKECAKEGLYGAVIGGIVSAVLPLFIDTMGPILSRWLTRVFPSAGPLIVRGARAAGNFLAGEGPHFGNGGEPEINPKPPTRPNAPKQPNPNPPNEPNPNPPEEPDPTPPKKSNPCDDSPSQTSPAEDIVEPTPPDARGLKAPLDSPEEIDQRLKDLVDAKKSAETRVQAANEAVDSAETQRDVAYDNYRIAQERAERLLGENYQSDPELVEAGIRRGIADDALGNAKQVLFDREKDLYKLSVQEAHFRRIQAPTARLIQAQQQFELMLQQGEKLREMQAAASGGACGAGTDLAEAIAAYDKEAAAISAEYKSALNAYWDAFFDEATPYESAPTQVDRFGRAAHTETQPGYPNGSPGTPIVGPGQAPPLPSQPQAPGPQGQDPPVGQSSAANSVAPPAPSPAANSIVGASGALDALGGPK